MVTLLVHYRAGQKEHDASPIEDVKCFIPKAKEQC